MIKEANFNKDRSRGQSFWFLTKERGPFLGEPLSFLTPKLSYLTINTEQGKLWVHLFFWPDVYNPRHDYRTG
jgi:hypothetical protein